MEELATPPLPAPRKRRINGWLWAVAVLAVVVLVLAAVALRQAHTTGTTGEPVDSVWPYLAVFALVFGDAIVALLPGETTLNVASTLAAQGTLHLGWVMVAGAAGAVAGDSGLYWIARVMRPRIQRQVDAAMKNGKIALAMQVIGTTAPPLLVFGRYVPGMRFVVNASLGLAGHRYREFVTWSAVGGVLWSIYCCSVAYLVGTALAGYPLASVIVAAMASSVAVVAVLFIVVRRSRAISAEDATVPDSRP